MERYGTRTTRSAGHRIVFALLMALLVINAEARADIRDIATDIHREQNRLIFDYVVGITNSAQKQGLSGKPLQNLQTEVSQQVLQILSLQYHARFGQAPPSQQSPSELLAQAPLLGILPPPAASLWSESPSTVADRAVALKKLSLLEAKYVVPPDGIETQRTLAVHLHSIQASSPQAAALMGPYESILFGYTPNAMPAEIEALIPAAKSVADTINLVLQHGTQAAALRRKLSEVLPNSPEYAGTAGQAQFRIEHANAEAALAAEVDATVRDVAFRWKQLAASASSTTAGTAEDRARSDAAAAMKSWSNLLPKLLAPNDPNSQALISTGLSFGSLLLSEGNPYVTAGTCILSMLQLGVQFGQSSGAMQQAQIIQYLHQLQTAIVALTTEVRLNFIRQSLSFADIDAQLGNISEQINRISATLSAQSLEIAWLQESVSETRRDNGIYALAAWKQNYDTGANPLARLRQQADADVPPGTSPPVYWSEVLAGTVEFASINAKNSVFTGNDINVSQPTPTDAAELMGSVIDARGVGNLWSFFSYLLSTYSGSSPPLGPSDVYGADLANTATSLALRIESERKVPLTTSQKGALLSSLDSTMQIAGFARDPAVVGGILASYQAATEDAAAALRGPTVSSYLLHTNLNSALRSLLDDYYPVSKPVASDAPILRFSDPTSVSTAPDVYATASPTSTAPEYLTEIDTLLANSREVNVDGSVRRFASAADIGFHSNYVAKNLKAYDGDALKAFAIPSALLRVNRVMEAMYGFSLFPANDLQQRPSGAMMRIEWRPRIYSIESRFSSAKGTCNWIPISIREFVRIRYDVSVHISVEQPPAAPNGPSQRIETTALELSIADPTLQPAGELCWSRGSHDENVATYYPYPLMGLEIQSRMKNEFHQALVGGLVGSPNWYGQTMSDLRDFMTSDGYLSFAQGDRSSRALIGKFGSSGDISLEWSYHARPDEKAVVLELEANALAYRQQFWGEAVSDLRTPGHPLHSALTRMDVGLRALGFSLLEGVGDQSYSNTHLQAAMIDPDTRLRSFVDFWTAVMAAQKSAADLETFVRSSTALTVRGEGNVMAGLTELLNSATPQNPLGGRRAATAAALAAQCH